VCAGYGVSCETGAARCCLLVVWASSTLRIVIELHTGWPYMIAMAEFCPGRGPTSSQLSWNSMLPLLYSSSAQYCRKIGIDIIS
jgi:hypothetical protein